MILGAVFACFCFFSIDFRCLYVFFVLPILPVFSLRDPEHRVRGEIMHMLVVGELRGMISKVFMTCFRKIGSLGNEQKNIRKRRQGYSANKPNCGNR